jgi:hypothetical protein
VTARLFFGEQFALAMRTLHLEDFRSCAMPTRLSATLSED